MLAPEITSYSQKGLGFWCFCVQFVPGTLGMKQDLPAELLDWYVGPLSLSFLPSLLLFFHSLCGYVYAGVHLYMCACVCACTCRCVCVCKCMGICACVYACTCGYLHVCMFVYVCACVFFYPRVCGSLSWCQVSSCIIYVTLFLRRSLSLNLALVYYWLASRGPRVSLTLPAPCAGVTDVFHGC